ncbi:transcription antitermination factor NusB [Corynebacterium sp. HS2168-gen11]|uniref:transcription antitermination factor NusB n=1 Tax=Corynebacterium sp. HS2168-gen11 TaxID=2974027 RepID=UPI00216AEAF6|nr:transcription antitermination factor NusB [Corynebacterium sp. HS2168-gen11]MCS4535164.1 transcription antitermination factor NusB [Corynebacterium sp. HS2168-gen11]
MPKHDGELEVEKRWKRHGSRFRARRRAVDMLYEAEIRDVDPVAVVQDRTVLALHQESNVAPVNHYTKEIVNGVAEQLDVLDAVIARYLSEDWELHRIAAVDRAILRLAIWELMFNEDIPMKTAVSEAIELAAHYSTDHSPTYINAVLDAVMNNLDEIKVQAEQGLVLELESAVSEEEDAKLFASATESFAEALEAAEAEDGVDLATDEDEDFDGTGISDSSDDALVHDHVDY